MQGNVSGASKQQILTWFCIFCASSEQHAVDELLQLAVKGVDIDGQVLAYLELAQVCSWQFVIQNDSVLFFNSAEGIDVHLQLSIAFF